MKKRDEQTSAGMEIKSWREAEAAAVHAARATLVHHTTAASAASLRGDPALLGARRSLHTPACSEHTDNPLPPCSTRAWVPYKAQECSEFE